MNETLNQTIIAITNQTTQINTTLLGMSIPLTSSPIFDIFLISLFGSLFITLVNKYLGDQTRMKALREEMKELRKKHREIMMKNPKKAQELQQQMMQKSMENMKHAMNPKIMLTTMIPMLFLFMIVRQLYSPYGEFWNLGFTTFGWLGTYLVSSIAWSIALKKILNVA